MSDMKLDPGYVRFVNKTPILNSLLYDLDLLPEQLMSQEEITPGLKKAFHDFHLIVGHFKMSAQQWQPIETAPKDGTRILVWNLDREEPEVAWFQENEEKWKWVTYDNAYKEDWPESWQQIPQPPEEE